MQIPIVGDQCAQFDWHFYSAPRQTEFEWSEEDVPYDHISLEALSHRIGTSIGGLYEEVQRGKLPAPVVIPGNRRGWKIDQIAPRVGQIILRRGYSAILAEVHF